MKSLSFLPRIAFGFASLIRGGASASGEGPLPKFTFQAIALEGKDLTFAPTGELERSSIIKTEGHIPNPLGKYYLYYSPHKHAGIGLAYSSDGNEWTQETTPLIEPIAGEGNDIYGPSLLRWQGRNFIVYQDHTGMRGGNVKYVEIDAQLTPVADQGERHLLIDPVPDSPIDNRFRGGEFYREGDTLYMYASGSEKPRVIVYATASAASVR